MADLVKAMDDFMLKSPTTMFSINYCFMFSIMLVDMFFMQNDLKIQEELSQSAIIK